MSWRDLKHHKPARSTQRCKLGPPRSGSQPIKDAPGREASSKQSNPHHAFRDPRRHPDGKSGLTKAERVQKVLAHAGLGSRRNCEELIKQGRVTIDGKIVRELGTRVDPDRARIAVDGETVRRESMVYYAVNKPKGYVSTNVDPAGKPRVVDLLPEIPQRVYSVGRLDEESTGLMILTNDGELANRLAHPRYGVEKLYRALIAGSPDPQILAKLTAGVWLSDGKVPRKRARLVGRQGHANVLELVLAEGKNREIRRMLAKLGHKVMSLNRVAVGPVTIKGLSSGEYRSLSRNEVDLLWKVANGADVSVPRFLDGNPSTRSRCDSNRDGEPNDRRRDRSGSIPKRYRGSAPPEVGPAQRPKRGRHPLAPRDSQTQFLESNRTDVAPRHTFALEGPRGQNTRNQRETGLLKARTRSEAASG